MKDIRENIFSDTNNKSMFSYVTDISNYQNKNECANYTPPFIGYIPIGVPSQSTDVDSDLKGMNQYLTKCTEYKYRPQDKIEVKNKKIEKECKKDFNIVPLGYLSYDRFKSNQQRN